MWVCQVGWTTLILEWEEDEQKGLQVKTPSWKQQYLCLVYSHYFHLCFTFTAQIMHRIPILMSYFVDHYARLLVSWFLLLHERLEKYILRYGYQGLLVACLVILMRLLDSMQHRKAILWMSRTRKNLISSFHNYASWYRFCAC